jgi:hypothetical protein
VAIEVSSTAIWTLDTCSGVLARRDPDTLRVERQTQTDVRSFDLAFGFGSIWLPSHRGTLRVDPVTLEITSRIPAARSFLIAVGSGSVWALDTGSGQRRATIRKIDPATNRIDKAATISVRS